MDSFKVDDKVCEIGNPKVKMTVIAVDEKQKIATCSWFTDRISKKTETKDFSFNQITLAKKYFPKRF